MFRFEGSVVVGVSVVAVASERRTARPQAAGTCRYHLPFNVADETVVAYSLEGKGCLRRPGSNTLGSEQ